MQLLPAPLILWLSHWTKRSKRRMSRFIAHCWSRSLTNLTSFPRPWSTGETSERIPISSGLTHPFLVTLSLMMHVTIQRDDVNHSSSNGHLPGRPVKSSGDKSSLVILVITTLILVIGLLNYLQLQQLRSVYETVLNESDEGVAETDSLKPRVWIQGKRGA